jgi:hypothetical protein
VALTVEGLTAKLEKTAAELPKTNQRALRAGLNVGKRIVQASMTTAGVPPGSKVAGGKVNVRYTPPVGRVEAESVLSMTGPAQLVNNPTKPHRIQPRSRGRKQRRALLLATGDFVADANHPGTKGKHMWEHAKPILDREVPKVIAAEHRAALVRNFRG